MEYYTDNNGGTWYRNNLQDSKVDTLRKLAKDKGLRGAERYKLTKGQLIDYLLDIDVPAPYPEPEIPVLQPESETVIPDAANGDKKLVDALTDALKGKISAGVNREDVQAIVRDTIKEDIDRLQNGLDAAIKEVVTDLEKYKLPKPITVTVKTPDGKSVEVGNQHYLFPKVLAIVSRRRNIMLVGPAGSGKTYLAGQVAEALKLTYAALSVGAQTTKTDLLGYMDANGKYVSSLLRRQYENGGIFLIDEIDAGNPNVITTLNAMTSNGIASFPDNMVKRHDDFVCIAAANTYGKGNDRQYVGRNALDAATLNRFVFLTMEYDEALEDTFTDNQTWKQIVRRVRASAAELKERVIVSPRATLHGAELLEDGFSSPEALDMTVFQGVAEDVKQKILNHAGV